MKKNNLTHFIARVISTIFVPPTFTVFLFSYAAFLIDNELSNRIFIIFDSLVFGFLLPIIVFIKLRKENRISDFDARIKEERNFPYFVNSLFCLAAIPPLLILKIDKFIIILWLVLFLNLIVLYLINRNWKISAHIIWGAILLGALMFFEGNINIWLILILVFIGWSRISLGIHNYKQVIAGGILGFTLTYLLLSISYNFLI